MRDGSLPMEKPPPRHVDHGAFTLRNWIFTVSLAIARSAISRPSVITATENNGSPIIGRIAIRSMNRPRTAMNMSATITLSPHCSQTGQSVR